MLASETAIEAHVEEGLRATELGLIPLTVALLAPVGSEVSMLTSSVSLPALVRH
jgi:hypothetical protein